MNVRASIPLLVFSDLDGTLLDHHSYDWTPARPALARLLSLGCGVVLATSKTAGEVAPLRAEMGLGDWPAIVENGAGVLAPGETPTDDPGDYPSIRAALDALPRSLRAPFTGFGDLDTDGVARVTGLPPAQARLARRRAFSEPGLWSGDPAGRAAFIAELARAGITARMGGRFLTLSRGRTKADAMATIVDRYRPAHTLALGDAPNDIEMLETAEIGVIIPNPDAPPLPTVPGEASGRIRRAPAAGPSGWNLAVTQAIEDFRLGQSGGGHG